MSFQLGKVTEVKFSCVPPVYNHKDKLYRAKACFSTEAYGKFIHLIVSITINQ